MSQDRTELERAQRGDRTAFSALYEGHADACWRLGVATGRDLGVAQAAVVHAFARVLGPARPDSATRFLPVATQLLRATRDTAIDETRADGPTDLSYLATGAPHDAAQAFDALPERWRSVLWLRHAEHLDLAQTSAVLGLREPDAEQLGERAIGGLREQLAKVHHPGATTSECQGTSRRLGGYVAGALTVAEAGRVRRHLDRCEQCRARLDDVDDLTAQLGHLAPGLPFAIEALAAEAWLARIDERSGPIGLRLPGGLLAPAWIERSLAGATAAMVSLGITAAVALSSRDGGNGTPIERIDSAAPTDQGQPLPGDTTGLDTDAGPISTSPTPTAAFSSTVPGSSDGSWGSTVPSNPAPPPTVTPAGEAPRGAPAPSPAPDDAPAPTPTTPPTSPPTTSPPTTSPSQPALPVDDIVGALDDVVDGVCGSVPVCPLPEESTALPQIPGL